MYDLIFNDKLCVKIYKQSNVIRGSVTVSQININNCSSREMDSRLLHLLKLECYSAVAAAFLAHSQTTQYTDWKEKYCTAHAERRVCFLQIANATRRAAADDNNFGGPRRGRNHNTNWCRFECSIVGHVVVERRSRWTMMNSGYALLIC